MNIGTLCIMDTVARPNFGAAETKGLHDLASIVEAHFRLHEARIARSKDDERYRLLADNSTDLIIRSDLDATRRYVSPAVRTILGYEPEDLLGGRPFEFIHPDDFETFAKNMDDLANARIERGIARQRYRHKDGRWIWVEVTFSLTRNPITGIADGFVSSLRDISDRMVMEDALRISEERLSLALDSGSDGLWDWNLTTGEVDLSGQWMTILGYGPEEIAPNILAWKSRLHPDDVALAKKHLVAHLSGKTDRLECEYRVRMKSGDYSWVLARGKIVARDAKGRPVRMVGTKIDITRRKEVERQIEHMAAHDALTGLPNRILFRDRLTRETSKAKQFGYTFAVLACDLDGFKNVNDTMGHSAGDTVLSLVAERLKAVVREGDMVARLGGDEFAIVLGQTSTDDEARAVACRVIEAIEMPIAIEGQSVRVSISVGISTGRARGADAAQLFRNADIALYRAKAAGRNTYCCYEAGMEPRLAGSACLEHDMQDVLQSGGLTLDYQPVILLATGHIVGFEALMRWEHPIRGKVPPSQFIPIAEESGMIVCLGEWALIEACREAASWPDHIRIAVNVSAVQFRRPGLEDSVQRALVASGLPADRLELEITESVLMQDAQAVISSLRRLRAMGVRIALDDFGTGYSSLSYLRQFPFNKIKIDRAFVQDIHDPNTAAIVRAVVGLGERVGAAITAEGVETEEQLKRVRQEGCTEVQGYFFSGPMHAEDAKVLITQFVKSAA
ncbi:bifunctional diguanylate cyclase/phosphodiesterase [Beijerinckia sp. L45]|uniref:putative bifunctional diguanylate cyclase/phosphodiesterase n=1 Tax=Beijerinckia sp. L45 TaxID=1641855 RepID=UPI00131E5E1E|nr:EAL domain-containing protein [Beijerinckia sp. L45]